MHPLDANELFDSRTRGSAFESLLTGSVLSPFLRPEEEALHNAGMTSSSEVCSRSTRFGIRCKNHPVEPVPSIVGRSREIVVEASSYLAHEDPRLFVLVSLEIVAST